VLQMWWLPFSAAFLDPDHCSTVGVGGVGSGGAISSEPGAAGGTSGISPGLLQQAS
jgi:hypothetical protein